MTVLPAILLSILLWILASPADAQTIVIHAGHLIDPAAGTAAANQTIVVRDGKIVEVGAAVAAPAGATSIDLSKAWVMPGLMDAHAHLTAGFPPSPQLSVVASYLRESSGLRAIRGIHNARLVLEAGFTAVKDIGNDGSYAAVDVRRAIEQGWFEGPTLLTTGKIIAPFGGQSSGVPPEMGPFWRYEYIDADSPDEVRRAVRENLYYGANAIKLVADNSAYYYSTEEMKAGVTEGHNAGVTVSVHVYGGEAARNAILAGADSLEHGFHLNDELLQLMKEKGTFLVGTDFPDDHLNQMGFNPVTNGKRLGQHIVDRLRRAHQAGVRMAFGTDVVLEPPDRSRVDLMLDYLDVWLAAGVPAADILRAMTVDAAELFRMQQTRGAIRSGLAADIIATSANPLDDIRALRQVTFVMKDGRIVKQAR